jgi:Zn-dependent M28 family amino/carboxypeptidase
VTRGFNEGTAWQHLLKQVSFGPRVPNTQGHRACRNYIEKELLAVCDQVERQEFSVPANGEKLQMCNIIGRLDLEKSRRILLLAHWDTRPTADMNPPGKRKQPIEGANDGASATAILLELARVFSEKRPEVGIDFLFTDGEDYGPSLDMMFLGAEHFAGKLSHGQVKAINYAILLDMVGDRSLDIHPETHSEGSAPELFVAMREINRKLGYNHFHTSGAYEIYDDHLPIMERGVKIYDFIDFNYPYWHTTEDKAERCSAYSLGSVGLTVENLVYNFPDLYGSLK